jgi:hypothetical protein
LLQSNGKKVTKKQKKAWKKEKVNADALPEAAVVWNKRRGWIIIQCGG